MSNGRHKWKKIADSVNELHFSINNTAVIEVDNKKITLIQKGEGLYACAYKCPHAGGILSEGYIDAMGNIVCPLHRYRFNFQNGRNVSGEGYFLKHWPVEYREDGIYIGMEEKGLFHF